MYTYIYIDRKMEQYNASGMVPDCWPVRLAGRTGEVPLCWVRAHSPLLSEYGRYKPVEARHKLVEARYKPVEAFRYKLEVVPFLLGSGKRGALPLPL